jgi:hypothetical protein
MVLLFNEQNRGGKGTGTGLNNTLLKHVSNLLFDLCLENRCIPIRPNKNRLCPRNKWDRVITSSARWQTGGRLK